MRLALSLQSQNFQLPLNARIDRLKPVASDGTQLLVREIEAAHPSTHKTGDEMIAAVPAFITIPTIPKCAQMRPDQFVTGSSSPGIPTDDEPLKADMLAGKVSSSTAHKAAKEPKSESVESLPDKQEHTPRNPNRKSLGVGGERAHEAIVRLKKIPTACPLRGRGFQIVANGM